MKNAEQKGVSCMTMMTTAAGQRAAHLYQDHEMRAKAKAALIRLVEALADRQARIDHEAELGKDRADDETRPNKSRGDLRPLLD